MSLTNAYGEWVQILVSENKAWVTRKLSIWAKQNQFLKSRLAF